MVITCGECGAHFRLDVALLKGGKGVRVRCRKCGGKIVVLRPEPPSVLSADDVVPISTGVPSAELKRGTSPAPEEGAAVGTDLPGDIRPEPGEQTQDKIPVRSDDETPESVPPELPGPIPPRLEDWFHSPAMDSGPDRNPSEENSADDIAPPGLERDVTSGGRSHTLKYFIVAGIAILLVAGGTLYYRTTKPGGERLGKLFPTYDIRDVKLSFEKQAASGTLFVVKGKVANFGKGPSGGIGIRVTLQAKDNRALAEKTGFAGNVLDEASLRRMDRAGIDAAMSNRFGEGDGNKEIPPGKSLPFLVVFFDPPGGSKRSW